MEIQTLVELFDERPLENVLGVEVFHPKSVVYVCAEGDSARKANQKKLRDYFAHRGLHPELTMVHANIYDTAAIVQLFRDILNRYPGCVMDITGGTDAVLFAAGLVCAEHQVPVMTYSRTMNRYYSIQNASFAHNLPCGIKFSVEDCFLMAGGTMRKGRVDNAILGQYMDYIDPFFALFLRHRNRWDKIVSYLQRISPADEDGNFSLEITGNYSVKGERGSLLTAPEKALQELEEIRMINELNITPGESVSFRFTDAQIRAWLRDVGSVLELYVYKACLDTGLFDDVRTSAIVDWDSDEKFGVVSNELDVMCTRGITPVFISCKTCMVKTEALNELSVLRDRFGGKIARAAIVTAEPAGAASRNRAADLNIRVIDLNDLNRSALHQRLHNLMH